MAWFKLMAWWWHSDRPIPAEQAMILRNLFVMQSAAFVLTVAAVTWMVFSPHNPPAIYLAGFGSGCIASIRYYVAKYLR